MRKTIVVAVREYQAAVRTKAFVITLVAMPILMGGSIAAQAFLKDKVDLRDRKLAVVDHTGLLFDGLAAAARERNTASVFAESGERRRQIQPRFLLEKVEPASDDRDQLLYDLSERVRSNEFFAFVVISADVLDSATPGRAPPVDYHSNSPTYRDLRRWLAGTLNHEIQQRRFERVGLDPAVVKSATRPVPIEARGLVSRDESGQITKAEKTNDVASFVVPAGLMMLMLMVVMVGASPLVNSVLEEKMQRIAEVLLGSIPPFELMMGKLLGTVGVSLTLATVYLGGAFVAMNRAGYGSFFPSHLILWFMLYQTLAVVMYGSVFLAVGAAVTDIKESQSLLMPVMVLVMAPLLVWTNVLKAPTAPFSVVVSLFPPATPMLMLLRQAIPPGVPLWQPLLGISLVAATTTLFVFAAGRVFRIGILVQGSGARFSQMIRWALRG